MAKEQGANKLLTNCPPCILSLEQGRELMREAGEPMEFGIVDFYKVFSRAFGVEGNVAGELNRSGWYEIAPSSPRSDWKSEASTGCRSGNVMDREQKWGGI